MKIDYLETNINKLKDSSLEANIKFHLNYQSLENLTNSINERQEQREHNLQTFNLFSETLITTMKKMNVSEKAVENCAKELDNSKELAKRLENESFALQKTLNVTQAFNKGVGVTLGKKIIL